MAIVSQKETATDCFFENCSQLAVVEERERARIRPTRSLRNPPVDRIDSSNGSDVILENKILQMTLRMTRSRTSSFYEEVLKHKGQVNHGQGVWFLCI